MKAFKRNMQGGIMKVREHRTWHCEYEIEIDGPLYDKDINNAIEDAWQTKEVNRWFVFTTDDGRKGRIKKLSLEIYDKGNALVRLNDFQKDSKKTSWLNKINKEEL